MDGTTMDDTGQPHRVVIVGAGHGGGTAAALLRQRGYRGEIILLGREPWLPYQRPPLSKGAAAADGVPELLHDSAFYDRHEIQVQTSTEVDALDIAGRQVITATGTVGYGALILATGCRARRLELPGADLGGVHTLRDFEDAVSLARLLRPGKELVVIGGGYIGMEAAAIAVERGLHVTVVEREGHILSRAAGKQLSEWLARFHRQRGVRLILGKQVGEFADDGNGSVTSVRLVDGGPPLPCDAVLVGAGAIPEDSIAAQAGLETNGGVLVDSRSRTSAPGVYAIGDVTRRVILGGAPPSRLESIHNAIEQADQAVADILGAPQTPPQTPWFWSDQFDLKIQIAGLVQRSVTVVERAAHEDSQRAWFHLDRDGTLVAVEAINDGQAFAAGKKWIREAQKPEIAVLADHTVKLRTAVAR